jgi:hypothetical protein
MPSPFDKDAILKGDVAQLRALFAAAALPAQLNRLYKVSVEHMVDALLNEDQLDKAFAPIIKRFKRQLIIEATSDSYFYTDSLHPLRRLLDCLLRHACYWYPHNTKSQPQFLQKYQHLVDQVILHATVSSRGADYAISEFNDFNQWIEAEKKRAELVESRLCQTTKSHFTLLEAECSVLNLINESLIDKYIPADAISLITGTLKSELQHCLINHGYGSAFWHSWNEMLPIFGRIFSADANQTFTRYSPHHISALLNELQCSLVLGSSNPHNYQHFIDSLSKILSQAAKQQPIGCVLFNALPYPEGYQDFSKHATRCRHTEVDALQIGSWIIFHNDDGQTIRCKLAQNNNNGKQWLFVDRTGRKVMVKSSAELSDCFNAGIAKNFTPKLFEDFFSHLLDKLIVQADQLAQKQKAKEKAEQAARQKQKKLEQKEQLADTQRIAAERMERERRLAEEEIKLAAIRKIKAEAIALASKKRRQLAAQLAKENASRNYLQRLESAKEQVASLKVGALVEIYSEAQTSQRCKLAAIITATGKYIFTDSLGRKFAEYQGEQLVQDILDNKLQFISTGDVFEDQLVKVIRGLRQV